LSSTRWSTRRERRQFRRVPCGTVYAIIAMPMSSARSPRWSRRSRSPALAALTALAPLALAVIAFGDSAACGGGTPSTGAGDDASVGPPPMDAAVEHVRVPYDGLPEPEAGPRTAVQAEFVSTRVETMELMFAAGEMQTSGEPFVQNFAGRNLAYYDRYFLPVDQYLVPISHGTTFYAQYTDLFGFSGAVESYEYSKMHMNMVANQTGAGVSLANGPLIAARPGATPRDKLRTRMQQLIVAAGTVASGYATTDAGAGNPLNDFGFAGLWPSLDPYRSFDPTMAPDPTIVHSCTTVTGYGGVQFFGSSPVNEYECAYNSLQLPDRTSQVEPVVGPGILGYTTWKESLWGVDFIGRLPRTWRRSGWRGTWSRAWSPPPARSWRPGSRARAPARTSGRLRWRACGDWRCSTRSTTPDGGSSRRSRRPTAPHSRASARCFKRSSTISRRRFNGFRPRSE
jgi:hypothetical protein